MSAPPRTVVVGAGIIGTLCAWRLAEAGHEVTLVDDGAPGAWQVAAGMLSPALEAAAGEEDLLALLHAGAQRWDATSADLEATTDAGVDHEHTGSLLVARTSDDLEALREVLAVHRELGTPTEPLRASACRTREPALHPRIRGGLWAPDDHRVDPRKVVAAARTAGRGAGVRVRPGRVTALTGPADDTAAELAAPSSRVAVDGVRLDDGEVLDADTVVLAGGWRSRELAGLPPDVGAALRPVKGQLVVLADPDGRPLLRSTVRGLVRGRPIYLVPRPDGRLVVGATEEERGADTDVTAGAVRTLLDDAVELVPGVDELILAETLAGSRPGTADGRPLIGATERPGLLLATGHHRHGVLLAPITAEAVVAAAEGAEPDPVLRCADPRRFTVTADERCPDDATEQGGTSWR